MMGASLEILIDKLAQSFSSVVSDVLRAATASSVCCHFMLSLDFFWIPLLKKKETHGGF